MSSRPATAMCSQSLKHGTVVLSTRRDIAENDLLPVITLRSSVHYDKASTALCVLFSASNVGLCSTSLYMLTIRLRPAQKARVCVYSRLSVGVVLSQPRRRFVSIEPAMGCDACQTLNRSWMSTTYSRPTCTRYCRDTRPHDSLASIE